MGSKKKLKQVLANETEYLMWQSAKARSSPQWIARVDQDAERSAKLHYHSMDVHGRSVLCIGARAGGEVRAFRSMGAFAVGIDLYPASGTNLVLPGNAHSLQFADSCVDVIY